jgi:hypothetical protein
MTYKGKVQQGVIVLDENVRLPEGTLVTVAPVVEPPRSLDEDAIYRLAELAVPTGIPDLARNIDHYLYGHPRQNGGPR